MTEDVAVFIVLGFYTSLMIGGSLGATIIERWKLLQVTESVMELSEIKDVETLERYLNLYPMTDKLVVNGEVFARIYAK